MSEHDYEIEFEDTEIDDECEDGFWLLLWFLATFR
jgi:hypothetical protein